MGFVTFRTLCIKRIGYENVYSILLASSWERGSEPSVTSAPCIQSGLHNVYVSSAMFTEMEEFKE
jgi:hypothetical protein